VKRRTLCQALALPSLALVARSRAQAVPAFRVAWVSLEQANSSSPVFAAFRAGMAELGYVEGNNLSIDAWWGAGSLARLEQMRGDILRAQPHVIVAQGGIALAPMLHASVRIPVLFSMSGDPVDAKIISSYAHPGGHVTGITLFAAELVGKRMELLKEVLPGTRQIAVIANPQHPGAERELQSSRAAAGRLGLALRFYPTRSQSELDTALGDIASTGIQAVIVLSDGFSLAQADRIAAFSVRHRIPVVAGWATFAERGNLMAYGPEFTDVFRRLASYADRIHKGASPADLPVEQPTKFELVINQKTARAIGVVVPQTLLLRADVVIQ